MREFASSFHDYIVEAMENHRGQVLRTRETLTIIIEKFPELEKKKDWIQPSDHCINHTNKGACYCAETEAAIFEKIEHGKYRVCQSLSKLKPAMVLKNG